MNQLACRLALTGLLIAYFPIFAQEAGGLYRFHIPADQEIESVYSDTTVPTKVEISPEKTRADDFKNCPAVSRLIFKIVDRIFDGNKLRSLLPPEAPVFNIIVECLKVAQTRENIGPDASSFGLFVPASLVEISKDEDEIAFAVSHEMSHILLQHLKVMPESRKSPLREAPWFNQPGVGSQSEKEADGLGIIMVANSGYDPRASEDSLCRLERAVLGIPALVPCAFVNYVPDSGHGSQWERIARIRNILLQIHYPKSPRRTVSKELNEARAEVTRIRERRARK